MEDGSDGEVARRHRPHEIALPGAQWELIELCVRVTQVLGIPRFVGEIFGFIFSTTAPVTFDEVVQALGISNGSASHGLRYLRRLGAIKVSFYARDRRDYLQVETSLHKLVSGNLAETVVHRMGGMVERLHIMQTHLTESTNLESAAISERVALLQNGMPEPGLRFQPRCTHLNDCSELHPWESNKPQPLISKA